MASIDFVGRSQHAPANAGAKRTARRPSAQCAPLRGVYCAPRSLAPAHVPRFVMAGLDPAIHVLLAFLKVVDARDKHGHDGEVCTMAPVSHPGRLLKRELAARRLSANRLSLDIGVPSGRITDILNARRSISADTAVRLGRYFGNGAQFWLDLQSQYDIAVVERDHGSEIARRVRPADAA